MGRFDASFLNPREGIRKWSLVWACGNGGYVLRAPLFFIRVGKWNSGPQYYFQEEIWNFAKTAFFKYVFSY
jgi:hypothetical protein